MSGRLAIASVVWGLVLSACGAGELEEPDLRTQSAAQCLEETGRVLLCHVTGNVANGRTLRVPVNAAANHIAMHPGDRCGACDDEDAACQACVEHACVGDVYLDGGFVTCVDACPVECAPPCPEPPELDCAGISPLDLFISSGTQPISASTYAGVIVGDDCTDVGDIVLSFDTAGTQSTFDVGCDSVEPTPSAPVTLYATDGDGNQSMCSIPINDAKAPTPICESTLTVQLTEATSEVFATDFLAQPTVDCSEPLATTLNDFNQNVDVASITVGCDDIFGGSTFVQVTQTDAVGNSDFCFAQLAVENAGGCVFSCPCFETAVLDEVLGTDLTVGQDYVCSATSPFFTYVDNRSFDFVGGALFESEASACRFFPNDSSVMPPCGGTCPVNPAERAICTGHVVEWLTTSGNLTDPATECGPF